MVGYSLSTVAAITAMSGSIEAFTPGTRGWARSITSTTTTERSSSLAFSSIRLCGACSQSHGNTCACSSCSRMSHSALCACPSCVESHSSSCTCASCSNAHSASCACASCSSLNKNCACPSCTGTHDANCNCAACGGL